MNRTEKKLAKKVLAFFDTPSNNHKFTREENQILERWRVHNIINIDAFMDITSHSSSYKEYLQSRSYPFTSYGDDEREKNWYLLFRNNKGIIIIRDILTVIAFLVSLYLAISNLL